jgi:hypothetical protein
MLALTAWYGADASAFGTSDRLRCGIAETIELFIMRLAIPKRLVRPVAVFNRARSALTPAGWLSIEPVRSDASIILAHTCSSRAAG